jgi:hypothetical protein
MLDSKICSNTAFMGSTTSRKLPLIKTPKSQLN